MSGTISEPEFPFVEAAQRYARGVVAGIIPACKWVKLACKRHLTDLDKSIVQGEWEYRFDSELANRACKFISLLPHTKGRWAIAQRGKPKSNLIRLEPWQCFIVCSIFGWVHAETWLRRYRTVYFCVPRKNGKSILAAAIGLYMLALDGEYGAEVYSGATSEKQAWEVFRPAKLMAERTPKFRAKYGVEVNAQTLCIPEDMSRFEPVIGKPGDGASPSCAIIDEFHEHKTGELVDTMETGMGAREQPLLLIITTAGDNTGGPCYALQLDVQRVLEGTEDNDSVFGIIYTIDEGDDWATDEALIKANPNMGVSVSADYLRLKLKEALLSSRKQAIFKTKHLNCWVGALNALFNMDAYLRLAEPTLTPEQFAGVPCWGGMDLASKVDIASKIKLFKRLIDGSEHYYFFARHYIPEESLADPDRKQYAGWVANGQMVATEGSMIDLGRIEDEVKEDAKAHEMIAIGYDPMHATQMAQRLLAEGVPMVEVPQNVMHMSEPTKWLDALITAGQIHHDGDPVMVWMIGNVTGKLDAKDNVYPRKETNSSHKKIDGAIALIMALGRAMAQAELDKSVYEERGFQEF